MLLAKTGNIKDEGNYFALAEFVVHEKGLQTVHFVDFFKESLE